MDLDGNTLLRMATAVIFGGLIGFNRDLYGHSISLDLIDWIREQRKFPGVDALKEQLSRDIDISARHANIDPSQPIASVL